MGKIFSKNNENILNNKIPKDLKAQYFSTINQILRYNYDQGFNKSRIENNMRICLEQKCFDELYDSEEIISPHYINWLDYLYSYLSIERNNNKEWASEMLIKLDDEPFLTENKYLSHFFFKEFYINTEPKCIKLTKDDDDIENSNDDYNNDRELKVSMSNSNMMRNLGGTFMANANIEVDNNSSNFEKENEIEARYKMFRNKVKKYIFIFRQHIVYKDHPINKVIQIFEETWVKYVDKKIQFIYNFEDSDNENEKYNINAIVDSITFQLQNFAIKMQNCLKLFYCRAIDFSCFNNEKDELINLITTLIFRTGRIYEKLFELQKIKLKSVSEDMENKYNQLKEITPQQLGIERQFCLNEETFMMQEEILEKEEKELKENDENIEEKDGNSLNKGVAQIYLTDEIMDKRKVQSLLADIKNKKNKITKYNINDINNIKVDIDFGDDNNNLLLTQNYKDRTSSISNDNCILPKSIGTVSSLDKITIKSNDEYTSNPEIKNSNNILYNNDNIDNDNNSESNLIIRENNNNNEGRKTLIPLNFVKIFNRVSFWKDPDKSGEFVCFPYETAIQLIKQIEKYKSPFEKMLIFASLGNEIKNCIDDFWKDMEDYIKSDLLGIEAEQLMTIFIYIITKAQIKDIIIHCKLIQLFTTSMTKSSMIGYYYSNAEASVSFIKNLKNVRELYKGKSRIFESKD